MPAESRDKHIQALLWSSLARAIVTLAFSLVFLGTMSLFISPASVILTLAYTITLLSLSARDRKRYAAVNPSSTADLSQPLHPTTSTLPSVCRLPAIICGFLLAALWLACFIVEMLLAIITSYRAIRGAGLLAVSYVELAFQAGQIGVLIALNVLCAKERRALRKAVGQETGVGQASSHCGDGQGLLTDIAHCNSMLDAIT
ncbi:hypothetical protein NMY22_g13075 [Coprinellus aureogranulatus]|nr:hypothetical protein NMY22_g13075 [Coprinellus aureogranulatus]